MSGAASPLAVPIPSIDDLTANAARLLQQSLAQAAQAAGPQSLGAVDLALARSNVAALAFCQGVGLHGAYAYLRDFVARQAVPSLSAGMFLDGWLGSYGMTRKPAAAAVGQLAGTGVSGTVLPAGTLLQTPLGVQLRSTAASAVVAGVVVVSVLAVLEGAAGNLASSTGAALVSPITGIDSGFVASAGLSGGADLETDTFAVSRLQQRLSYEPRGGCPADYARWALAVPGITRAWGVRNPAGPGTAGVVVMADVGSGSGLPSRAQQGAVFDYIRDPQRGPPDELFVIIPSPVAVNVTLHIAPDTAAIRVGVVAALQDLFFREAAPGLSIPHSHLTEAISGVVGEYNHAISAPTIVSGAFFTAPTFDALLLLGTVSFT